MTKKSIQNTYDLIFRQLRTHGVKHSSNGAATDTYFIGSNIVVQRIGKEPADWRENIKGHGQKYKGMINGKRLHPHIPAQWLFSLAEVHHNISKKTK